MSSLHLNFYEEETKIVNFELEGLQLQGKLEIGRNTLPRLTILSNKYFEDNNIESVSCECIESSTCYVLHDVDVRGDFCQAKSVTKTRSNTTIEQCDALNIKLTGLHSWLEEIRRFNITDESISRDVTVKSFSVNFKFSDQAYNIKNSRSVSSRQDSATKYEVEIDDYLIVTKEKGNFNLDEINNLAHEIRNLFSLLVGYPLSLETCWLHSPNVHRNISVIFGSVLYDKQPFVYGNQTLLCFKNLINWEVIERIIVNFFTLNTFRHIWCRLVPLLPHSGTNYWEHEILSTVVTLEMYCAKKVQGTRYKLPKNIFRSYKQELVSQSNEFIKRNELQGDDLQLIANFIEVINNLKNTSQPTLKEKYYYLMESQGYEAQSIANFSATDFDVIRNIRNSIAHGVPYTPHEEGYITTELRIKDRLHTLLTYFALVELGLSDTQIALSLTTTSHDIISNAGINKVLRDKLSGTIKFLHLTTPPQIEYSDRVHLVVREDSNTRASYSIDLEMTNEVEKNWIHSSFKDIRDFVSSKLGETEQYTVEYLSRAYICYENLETECSGVILLASSDSH
ncbi:hypothetical protein [Pseudoalteromonas sp. T1lg22]|uniref:ApeA N-terminal domain 1-containing protein n=1 Tax=Pseudoalteromonas sp. T1lg22 TaxID=2077096 RepID=UPI00131A26FF|nr:hypothetical protein [Pseudoalteromonas sp. T1lg22]